MSEPSQPTSVLEARVERENDCVRVSLAGEFELATHWEFASAVATVKSEPPCDVVLDLRCLRFMDSVGLGAILDLAKELPPGRLRIIPGDRAVQRVFEIAGLTSVLPFVTSDEAR